MPWITQQRKARLRRWWRRSRQEPPERRRKLSRTRRSIRIALAIVGTAGLGWLIVDRMQALPRVEPPFERIVGPGAGPVKEFALRDIEGRMHTAAEWANHSAAVLVVLSPDCRASRDSVNNLNALARDFGPKGFAFLAIDPTPGSSSSDVARAWAESRPEFPVMLDPSRRVVRQAGVEVTPTAVVVLPDGQVIYRGPIDDRIAADGKRRARPTRADLRAALEAILNDEMPAKQVVAAHGTPLAPVTASALEVGEPVTFNKHVAPILWNNCAMPPAGERRAVPAPELPRRAEAGRFLARGHAVGPDAALEGTSGGRRLPRRDPAERAGEGDPGAVGRDGLRRG